MPNIMDTGKVKKSVNLRPMLKGSIAVEALRVLLPSSGARLHACGKSISLNHSGALLLATRTMTFRSSHSFQGPGHSNLEHRKESGDSVGNRSLRQGQHSIYRRQEYRERTSSSDDFSLLLPSAVNVQSRWGSPIPAPALRTRHRMYSRTQQSDT